MKKKLVIFCDNYLGFTLLCSGGVLENLINTYKVTIITDPSAVTSIKKATHNSCDVMEHSIVSDNIICPPLFRMINNVLSMTYARTQNRRNLSGILHRKAHLKLVRNKSIFIRLQKHLIVQLSLLAEKSKSFRHILNALFYHLAHKESLAKLIADINPALCIATTAGLENDGVFFAASKKNKIPCLALIQSWERTATKGYPTVKPDYCIVWSEPMAKEAEIFLEIPKDRVFVEGAPPWDNYKRNENFSQKEKEAFFKKWNLDPDKNTLFVALNSYGSHDENIELIKNINSATQNNQFSNIQFMFRTHPNYLVNKKGSDDIKSLFQKNHHQNMALMHPIVVSPEEKNYIVTDEDRHFMKSMFTYCDVTVSIMSTWMIESSIFDKPNVCIEYGRYITSLYDFDLSEYKAEHIERIFAYNAVYRAKSANNLIELIQFALTNPDHKATERSKLADLEVGPNKGQACEAFIKRINSIINI